MASTSASALMLSSGTSEQSGAHGENSNMNFSPQPPSQQSRNSSQGPLAILWDIENCRVPRDVRPEDVAGNIRMALRADPIIKGPVTLFSAYGDFNTFPRQLREGCQRTGVKLIDVPNGRKDAADKAILVDMFLFALDNPPPSSIMLISGDVDFAPALHVLGQRGYTVILVIPSGVGVSSALSNAGRFVWDWHSVAGGEGFVLPSRNIIRPRVGPAKIAGYRMGCHINGNPNGMNEGFGFSNTKPKTMSTPKKIVLKSSDGETFEVEETVALESQTIKHMIKDDCADNTIPLPNVNSKILAKVIEYCRKHVEASGSSNANDLDKDAADNEALKKWDAEFVNVDQGVLFDLILAAEYLNIKSLQDLTCQTVADMIPGSTPEEILNNMNYFALKEEEEGSTPEEILNNMNYFALKEEEEVRWENAWAFE
ncbi:hypothetical protein RHMOL_Rhmol05G0065400 [Rhododendron molle]|uniref:Uncharacterized protein n=2 Tax=Rhododendron molle TaxID=49168 RepID=A0ACC0NKX9_RHOML|nr:hypothetical protein RHMOL_Rhmol05G0065400 [Rhododendron molle]KAI8554028.1 hypothetical protein RHMOL_Rhmol05G0065400 [Rhododendron molle]